MSDEIRKRFAEIAAQADDEIRLDEAALLIAAEAQPEVSVEFYLDELDKLAIRFREDARFDTKLGVPVTSLISYIHEDAGFTGNVTDYYDPANSYLNRVIDVRQGIPISLALIHISMGMRLSIPVVGISFP